MGREREGERGREERGCGGHWELRKADACCRPCSPRQQLERLCKHTHTASEPELALLLRGCACERSTMSWRGHACWKACARSVREEESERRADGDGGVQSVKR
eukprot:912445-Rhodomonas_salina.1